MATYEYEFELDPCPAGDKSHKHKFSVEVDGREAANVSGHTRTEYVTLYCDIADNYFIQPVTVTADDGYRIVRVGEEPDAVDADVSQRI